MTTMPDPPAQRLHTALMRHVHDDDAVRRSALVAHVAADLTVDTDVVDAALDDLTRAGELYEVPAGGGREVKQP